MPKLTDKQLQMRKLEMAARSRAAVAKKELVQFRLEADKIVKLYEIAAENEMPMGTMLREWVSERIAQEQSGFPRGPQSSSRASLTTELFAREGTTDFNNSASREHRLDSLEQRIAKLESKSKQLKTRHNSKT